MAAPRATARAGARAQRQGVPLRPSRHRAEACVGAAPGLARAVPVVRAGQASQASAAPPVAPGAGVEARASRGAPPRPSPTQATGPLVPVPIAVAGARSSVVGEGVRPTAPDVPSQAGELHAVPAEDAARPVDVEGAPEATSLVAHRAPDVARRGPYPSSDAAQARSEARGVTSLARVGAAATSPSFEAFPTASATLVDVVVAPRPTAPKGAKAARRAT